MTSRMRLFANCERPQMRLLRFIETAFVRIKDSKIIQNRRDIGVDRTRVAFRKSASACW